ncbi:iron complex outermembrane receptor protein [Catalinimonas alkaloidigena]|nr:iron complex outermembrane receptor protein [Catalinimonas alkaloidigena]
MKWNIFYVSTILSMKTLSPACLFWVVFCLNASPLFAQNNLANIEGSIVQASDGAPVPGANITLLGSTYGSISDLEGRFVINNIPEGVYEMMVSFVGYKTYNETLALNAGEKEVLSIRLEEDILALDGLIVTAQKRTQLVQDVPIAITTYDGSFLQETNIFEFDALSDYVPGLQVQIQSVNNPGFVVRGITSDNGDARIEPRVSVFQDGVSISKSRGSVVELYDMERVEVLKGPQGTLFGRGAQIGAIHLIQQKAQNQTTAELKAGFGNYGQYLLTGHLNLPIVENKLFARVAGIFNEREGFIDNHAGGKLNGKETKAFRTAWRYLPDRKTVVDFIFNYQLDTPPGTSFKSGTYAPAGGDTSPFTFAELERGEELGVDRTVWGATLLVNRSLTNMWDLTSITAYRAFDSYEAFDADGTVAPALWIAEEAIGKQFSQEVRFNYNNLQGFSGFGGVNFFWEDGSQSTPVETDERSLFALLNPFVRGSITNNPAFSQAEKEQLLAAVPLEPLVNPDGTPNLIPNLPDLPQFLGPLAGLPLKSFHREGQTNYGKNYAFEIFADGTYELTDALDVTLGVRGTFEHITGAIESQDADSLGLLGFVLGNFPNNIFPPTNGRVSHSESYLSAVGRLALDYEVSESLNVFASIARGRRPNVIQVLGTDVSVLNDEIVWSYEVGTKLLSRDNRLQWDLNAYYYDYSDFQTQVARLTEDQGLVFETRDVGNATALGFETAMQYVLARPLQVFANYAFIHARFDDTDSEGNEQSLADNTFRLTPKHSGSLGLNFEMPVASWGRVFFRPTYNYKSKVYFEEENQPNIAQDGYGLLNVRTGMKLWRGIYEVAFYINNALNEEYLIDAGNTGEAFGIPTFIAGPPRLFGIQLSSRLL